MKSDDILEFENYEQQTAILRLNRPTVHNSINAEMMQQLEKRIDEIEADSSTRCIVLTGAGSGTFCAGGDLRYFATLTTREDCLAMSKRMQAILNRLWLGKRVVIAAVNGQALGGGCEILTACHLRIAARSARFAFRQAPNGIITGWGGGRRLIRLLGKSQALRLLLSGEYIDAEEALRIGFVTQVVDASELLAGALDLAGEINKNSRKAVEEFLELAMLAELANWEMVVEEETERFADLWMGNEFQTFLKKYL